MRRKPRRLVVAAGLIAGGGYLLSGASATCTSFAGESALAYTDFCFIFDCQNGFFGGVVDPCSDDPLLPSLFVDCPTLQ